MKDTTKTKRGTQRQKRTNTRKVAEEVNKVNVESVANSYLASQDLVSVDDFAKSAGVSKKDLAKALEDKEVEFFRYDMLQQVPCTPDYTGELYAIQI